MIKKVEIMAQWKYHGERLETLDNIVVARTCLEGNTHRLAPMYANDCLRNYLIFSHLLHSRWLFLCPKKILDR